MSPQAFSQLEGYSFADARRSFRNGTVCGIIAADGSLQLNPEDSTRLVAGDKLVVVAADLGRIWLAPKPLQVGCR
jgi:hypothetical protein